MCPQARTKGKRSPYRDFPVLNISSQVAYNSERDSRTRLMSQSPSLMLSLQKLKFEVVNTLLETSFPIIISSGNRIRGHARSRASGPDVQILEPQVPRKKKALFNHIVNVLNKYNKALLMPSNRVVSFSTIGVEQLDG